MYEFKPVSERIQALYDRIRDRVIEIDKEQGEVVFDLNHPLAGKALTFEVEILEIEDAPENFVSAQEKTEHLKQQSKLLGADQADSYR